MSTVERLRRMRDELIEEGPEGPPEWIETASMAADELEAAEKEATRWHEIAGANAARFAEAQSRLHSCEESLRAFDIRDESDYWVQSANRSKLHSCPHGVPPTIHCEKCEPSHGEVPFAQRV